MPDDSAPEFRTSQTDHATRVRDERKLMRISGKDRRTVRNALAQFARDERAADLQRQLASIPIPRALEPAVSSETQAFTPQALTLGEIPGQGGPGLTGTHVDPELNLRVRLLVEDAGGAVGVETVDLHGEIV